MNTTGKPASERPARRAPSSFRSFCAVAARWNSSRAPHGPHDRRRSSLEDALEACEEHSTFYAADAMSGLCLIWRCPVSGPHGSPRANRTDCERLEHKSRQSAFEFWYTRPSSDLIR